MKLDGIVTRPDYNDRIRTAAYRPINHSIHIKRKYWVIGRRAVFAKYSYFLNFDHAPSDACKKATSRLSRGPINVVFRAYVDAYGSIGACILLLVNEASASGLRVSHSRATSFGNRWTGPVEP